MFFLNNKTKQLLYKQAKNIVLTNQSLTKKMVKYYLDNKDYKAQQNFKDVVFIIISIVVGIVLGVITGYYVSSANNALQNLLLNNGKYVILLLGIPLLLSLIYFIQYKIKAYFGLLNKEDTYYILSKNIYDIVVSQQHLQRKD